MRAPLPTALLLALAAACGDDNPQQPDAPPLPPPPDASQPDAMVEEFTQEELAMIATLSPLPAVPASPTNMYADSAAAARLGQMLFFDKSYAGALITGDDGTNGGLGVVGDTGKVSCASCHAAGSGAMDDLRTTPNNVSLGTNFGPRNAHGVVNSSFYRWTNWGGRFDSAWSLPTAVAENANIMNGNRLQLAHVIWTKYRTEYAAAFPEWPLDPRLDPAHPDAAQLPPAGKPGQPAFDNLPAADKDIVNRILANYGKALEAHVRTLVSRDAPFDGWVAGDRDAIDPAARRGLKLFLRDCIGCHSGPNFADDQFHALAVPQTGPRVPGTDNGRFQDVPGLLTSPFNSIGAYSDDATTGMLTGLVQDPSQTGQFRTKSLRNVATSAPYMHAGQHTTLTAVVEFYAAGGGVDIPGITKDPMLAQITYTGTDIADLVAFMETLTGAPVPPMRLVDTSK